MRNQPISPPVYTTPPSLQQQRTTEEQLTEIAYRLTDLSTELLQLLTGPVGDPSSRNIQQSDTTNQEEPREDAGASQARGNLAVAVKQEEDESIIDEPSHSNQVLHQLHLAQANLARICTNTSSATSQSNNSEESTEILEPSAKTARTRSRNTTASSAYKKQRCTTTSSRTTKHSNKSKQQYKHHQTNQQSSTSTTTTFNPGDQVQIIGGQTYQGHSAIVVKETGKQVCIRIGKKFIYRKKKNLKKLNF